MKFPRTSPQRHLLIQGHCSEQVNWFCAPRWDDRLFRRSAKSTSPPMGLMISGPLSALDGIQPMTQDYAEFA
jgi:hypothetical protein